MGGNDVETPESFERARALAQNRAIYEWDRLPGLPPFCKGLPEQERSSRYQVEQILYDLTTSIGESLMAKRSFAKLVARKGHQLSAYEHLRPYGQQPSTATRWKQDDEFARQRLNGVNPLQIERVTSLPDHLAVDDGRLEGVLAPSHSLAQLRDEGRLYLCDWAELVDVPVTLGRFLTAPTALFWVDDTGTLMPLAIQLDRDHTVPAQTGVPGPPVVFTPADDPWLWLTARTHVQSADAAYHETVVHLLRTHLVMETVWVATRRGLPPQHPVHRLLEPHFAGTIAINYKARNELIVPGGPIDLSISVGTDGAYWLINQALKEFSFQDLDPIRDLTRRGVDGSALPGYHYRDDAIEVWEAISDFTEEVLRCFYPDDAAIAADSDLHEWAYELVDDDAGNLRGLSLVDGRFARFADLHHVVRQVIFTASAEHSSVNNGQYDVFGWIPNSPGAIFLPHPTSLAPSSEGEFAYGLPPFKVAEMQIALVHLLSQPQSSNLGDYPPDFFHEARPVRLSVDRFRKRLDELSMAIEARNLALDVPYTYLDPATVAPSISV